VISRSEFINSGFFTSDRWPSWTQGMGVYAYARRPVELCLVFAPPWTRGAGVYARTRI